MKTITKNICLSGLVVLLACMSSMTFAQRGGSRGGSFGGGGGYSAPRSTYSPPRSTYSPPSSMGSGSTMGSGIKSAPSTSGQMKSGGTMGSGIKSSTNSSSQMRSGGAMNSTPPKTNPASTLPKTNPSTSATTSTSTTTRPSSGSSSSTQYRYKSYSGPRTTTYNGRSVYVDAYGGYSYYPSGPVIAYMPGYTPVAYSTPMPVFAAPNPFWPLVWICLIVVVIFAVVYVLVKG